MISLKKKLKASKYNANSLDKKLVLGLSKSRIPSFKQLKYINKYLNKVEITVLYSALAILIITIGVLTIKFYNQNTEIQPRDGGKYIEAVIGGPKYINPLYASLNDIDADLSNLIYSSLFKRDNYGYLAMDLATSYKISEDQKAYTITIRNDARWHNDEPLTIDDVVFTLSAISDSDYKSPLRYNFNGVEVSKIDEQTIQFILKEPYAPFMEFLTFGILPKTLWQDITPASMSLAKLNLKPIGSGPYKFKSLTKDQNGNIKAFTLKSNQEYYKASPHVEEVIFKFFVSPEEMVMALNNNKVDAINYLPSEYFNDIIAHNSFNFHQLSLPQISGLFFNGRNDLYISDIVVRQALAYALNKPELVEEVLAQQAQVIDGPILPSNFAFSDNITTYNYDVNKAKQVLADKEWAYEVDEETNESSQWLMKNGQELSVELTIPDNPMSLSLAQKIQIYWQEIGIKTTIKAVAGRDIQNTIIKKRDFEILLYSLFGSVDPDPYAFWHSSQRTSLNITDYNNSKVDKLLEEARTNNDLEARKTNYAEFQEIITEDLPAIFLYNQSYVYIQNKRIKGFAVDAINQPMDRLNNIQDWYTKQTKRLQFSDN